MRPFTALFFPSTQLSLSCPIRGNRGHSSRRSASGIEIEEYQLDPVVRALRMPERTCWSEMMLSVVYKYCNSHGVDILGNLELKITPPNQFNDPFEFAPHMICSNPMRRLIEVLKDKKHLKGFYVKAVDAGWFAGSFCEFRVYAKEHRREMAQEMCPLFTVVSAETGRELLSKVSTTHGLLCLSKTRESILMWGHYTDNHRGLVIGFDSAKEEFKGLKDVNYVRERVQFDAGWMIHDRRVQEFEKKIVFSKNLEWRYEQEVRQFMLLHKLKLKALSDGTPGFFWSLPREAIVSVTLGARCTPDLEQQVRSAIQNSALNHVSVDRAQLHETEFRLIFK